MVPYDKWRCTGAVALVAPRWLEGAGATAMRFRTPTTPILVENILAIASSVSRMNATLEGEHLVSLRNAFLEAIGPTGSLDARLSQEKWLYAPSLGKMIAPIRLVFQLPDAAQHGFEPFRVLADRDIARFKIPLLNMGAKEKLDARDLVEVLKEMRDGGILDAKKAARVLEALKDVWDDKRDGALKKDVLLPRTGGELVPASSLSVRDWGDLSFTAHNAASVVDDAVHPRAAYMFGASSLRSVASELAVVPFEQYESMPTRIKGILEDYPSSALPREFLQNADDAGATRLDIILDMRTFKSDCLVSAELGAFQGPALVFFNDASFREEDFQGIKSLGMGSKGTSNESAGQFGVGFCSAFHVSDCPVIASAGYLCVLDPRRRYLPGQHGLRPGGLRYNASLLKKQGFSDHVTPFCEYIGRDLSQGTAFRLPLRTMDQAKGNELGRGAPAHDITGVRGLLGKCAEKAEELLLFTRNVHAIRVGVRDDGGLTVLCDVKKDLRARANGAHVISIAQTLKERKEALCDDDTIDYSATYVVGITSIRDEQHQRGEWVVAERIVPRPAHIQPPPLKKPCVAVALPIVCNKPNVAVRKTLYAIMPLDEDESAGIPASISATFHLTTNRRVQSGNQPHNQWLLSQLIPDAYCTALLALREEVAAVKTPAATARQLYNSLPVVSSEMKKAGITNAIQIAESTIRRIVNQDIAIFLDRNATWQDAKSAIFFSDVPEGVAFVLSQEGHPLCDTLGIARVAGIADVCKGDVRMLTPELCIDILRDLDIAVPGGAPLAIPVRNHPGFAEVDKIEDTLKYCLSAHNVGNNPGQIIGLPLLVVAEGRALLAFGPRAQDDNVIVAVQQKDRDILRKCERLPSVATCTSISKHLAPSTFHKLGLALLDFKGLLSSVKHVLTARGIQPDSGVGPCPQEWLTWHFSVMAYMRQHGPKKDEWIEVMRWPLIPGWTADGGLRVYAARKDPVIVIVNRATEVGLEAANVISSLGCPVWPPPNDPKALPQHGQIQGRFVAVEESAVSPTSIEGRACASHIVRIAAFAKGSDDALVALVEAMNSETRRHLSVVLSRQATNDKAGPALLRRLAIYPQLDTSRPLCAIDKGRWVAPENPSEWETVGHVFTDGVLAPTPQLVGLYSAAKVECMTVGTFLVMGVIPHFPEMSDVDICRAMSAMRTLVTRGVKGAPTSARLCQLEFIRDSAGQLRSASYFVTVGTTAKGTKIYEDIHPSERIPTTSPFSSSDWTAFLVSHCGLRNDLTISMFLKCASVVAERQDRKLAVRMWQSSGTWRESVDKQKWALIAKIHALPMDENPQGKLGVAFRPRLCAAQTLCAPEEAATSDSATHLWSQVATPHPQICPLPPTLTQFMMSKTTALVARHLLFLAESSASRPTGDESFWSTFHDKVFEVYGELRDAVKCGRAIELACLRGQPVLAVAGAAGADAQGGLRFFRGDQLFKELPCDEVPPFFLKLPNELLEYWEFARVCGVEERPSVESSLGILSRIAARAAGKPLNGKEIDAVRAALEMACECKTAGVHAPAAAGPVAPGGISLPDTKSVMRPSRELLLDDAGLLDDGGAAASAAANNEDVQHSVLVHATIRACLLQKGMRDVVSRLGVGLTSARESRTLVQPDVSEAIALTKDAFAANADETLRSRVFACAAAASVRGKGRNLKSVIQTLAGIRLAIVNAITLESSNGRQLFVQRHTTSVDGSPVVLVVANNAPSMALAIAKEVVGLCDGDVATANTDGLVIGLQAGPDALDAYLRTQGEPVGETASALGQPLSPEEAEGVQIDVRIFNVGEVVAWERVSEEDSASNELIWVKVLGAVSTDRDTDALSACFHIQWGSTDDDHAQVPACQLYGVDRMGASVPSSRDCGTAASSEQGVDESDATPTPTAGTGDGSPFLEAPVGSREGKTPPNSSDASSSAQDSHARLLELLVAVLDGVDNGLSKIVNHNGQAVQKLFRQLMLQFHPDKKNGERRYHTAAALLTSEKARHKEGKWRMRTQEQRCERALEFAGPDGQRASSSASSASNDHGSDAPRSSRRSTDDEWRREWFGRNTYQSRHEQSYFRGSRDNDFDFDASGSTYVPPQRVPSEAMALTLRLAARDDLDAARVLSAACTNPRDAGATSGGGYALHAHVCFSAQQSVDKAVKAVVAFTVGIRVGEITSDDTNALLKHLCTRKELFVTLRDACAPIAGYFTNARHVGADRPSASLSEAHAAIALRAAERMLRIADDILFPSDS